jgi:hypothetical protein
MSNPTPIVHRRRERRVFHYKVDETLRPEHRDVYLAMIRHPATRLDDAHAWLLARGYQLSRSAVARHRRRLLARDAEHEQDLDRAVAYAKVAGGKDAPDFAAGMELQLQHLVFQHLMELDRRLPGREDDEDEVREPMDTAELLRLSKLVAQVVETAAKQIRTKKPDAPAITEPTAVVKRTDERLRKDIEDILAGRK